MRGDARSERRLPGANRTVYDTKYPYVGCLFTHQLSHVSEKPSSSMYSANAGACPRK
jgi:hypothetical protein